MGAALRHDHAFEEWFPLIGRPRRYSCLELGEWLARLVLPASMEQAHQAGEWRGFLDEGIPGRLLRGGQGRLGGRLLAVAIFGHTWAI